MKKKMIAAMAVLVMLSGCGREKEVPVVLPAITETPREAQIPPPNVTLKPTETLRPSESPETTETPGSDVASKKSQPEVTEAPKLTEAPMTVKISEGDVAPKRTEEPDATGFPGGMEASGAPEDSGTTEPLPAETPAATQPPRATEIPAATKEPGPTEAPAVTEAPELTETPKPTETSKPTETPEPTNAPAATETPAKCEHDMNVYVFREPDCKTGEGYVCDLCSKCGYTENHRYVPYEHDFEDKAIPGDCISPAWHEFTCRNCGWTEKKLGEIDINNHCNMQEVTYTRDDEETWETVTYRAVKCLDCNTVFEEEEISRELIVE